MQRIKTAIVGAGPAGISAAVYLKRAGFDVSLFEKEKVGGLLNNAHKVENYPGFPYGISGTDLIRTFEEQLKKWDVPVIATKVRSIRRSGEKILLDTDQGNTEAEAVIIASGTRPKKMELPGESELAGRLIFYEVKDVPHDPRDAKVLVIGSGDCAYDYALNLAEQSARVEILMRSEDSNCIPLLEERAEMNDGILINTGEVTGFCTSGNRLIIESIPPLCVDFALVAIGREPDDALLSCTGRGIFPAGDVTDPHFRQVGIAVGSGLKAAMSAELYLKNKNYINEDIK